MAFDRTRDPGMSLMITIKKTFTLVYITVIDIKSFVYCSVVCRVRVLRGGRGGSVEHNDRAGPAGAPGPSAGVLYLFQDGLVESKPVRASFDHGN